jgi:hypothetical protein
MNLEDIHISLYFKMHFKSKIPTSLISRKFDELFSRLFFQNLKSLVRRFDAEFQYIRRMTKCRLLSIQHFVDYHFVEM